MQYAAWETSSTQGEVLHVAIKTNGLLKSWESPAGFRSMSTAPLIREITAHFSQEDWTQHDGYTAC